MSLSSICVEIRLKIYSELLVDSEPIEIGADYGPTSRPLHQCRRKGLYPAILRVSRMMHHEAVPVLYSGNSFRFPKAYWRNFGPPSAHMLPFIDQIGSSRASLLRNITIPFPSFDYSVDVRPPGNLEPILHEVHMDNLELIRGRCRGLQTLELLVPNEVWNYALCDHPDGVVALGLLERQLKGIVSLREVTVHFQLYPDCSISNDLTNRMRGYGWTVTVTELPPKVWISYDDQVAFDNEEDCKAYDDMWFQEEMEEGERSTVAGDIQ